MRGSFLVFSLLAWATLTHASTRPFQQKHQSIVGAPPKPPVWPNSYEVSYVISLPYTATVQPTAPLKYPVHIWWDGIKGMQRVSFYDGLDDTYITPEAMYNVYPRITKRSCLVIGSGGGPTLLSGLLGSESSGQPLPDITGWEYAGTAALPGVGNANVWQSTVKYWEKVNTYTFFTSQVDGRPLKLMMMGVNLFTGSHFDQYEVEFGVFGPIRSPAVFKPPVLCDDAARMSASIGSGMSHAVRAQLLSVTPSAMVMSKVLNANLGHADNTLRHALGRFWAKVTGHSDANTPDVASTGAVLASNLEFIRNWNAKQAELSSTKTTTTTSSSGAAVANPVANPVAPADMFKLGVNKFIGWTHEQWQATVMGLQPHRSKQSAGGFRSVRGSSAYLGQFQRRLPNDQLPKEVDWRGTGADGSVKDQASCGSCWAFATTGAMTGAWFKATGQSLSFSEQQIVDCSWNYEVNGCWGGNVEPALEYIAAHGGAALEAAYPYLGQNSFCKENKTSKAGKFKGFMSVAADEHALMEVVATHGPVAIAFDAVHPTFKYYSEGVYFRQDCGQDVDHLNHAVVLVGYGTTPDGTDYWLLRNSWSQLWGDGGYFKMARKVNDCGVTLDAVLAVVDEKAAAEAVAK